MSKSLRIAFFTDSFLPATDGVVTSILDLRETLTKMGHEVHIFAPGDAQTRKMAEGMENVHITSGIRFDRYPQYRIAVFPLSAMMATLRIKPDIIHAHTPFVMGAWAIAAAKVAGVPIIGTFHTAVTDKTALEAYAPANASEAIRKHLWGYLRFFYSGCDAVTAPSDTFTRLLKSKGIDDVVTVPNGVDTKKFNARVDGSRLRKKFLRKGEERIVLYVGRMSREKKIETLLHAAALLKGEGIRFLMVGGGPAMEYYKAMAKRLGLSSKVTFTGMIPHSELPPYYASADVFCLPSTFETQGIVCIEAMASGKPVVGADSLALKEIITNGVNGEKFAPGSAKACAEAIKKVINNVRSYKGIAMTAREYSLDKTSKRLIGVYRAAMESKRGR